MDKEIWIMEVGPAGFDLLMRETAIWDTDAGLEVKKAVRESHDYLAETSLTASGVFRCDHIGREELRNALIMVASYAGQMNRYKKAMFRKQSRAEAGLTIAHGGDHNAIPFAYGAPLAIPEEFADLFHGIIGNITEVGEQAEILLTYLDTGVVDKVNVSEEIGDNLWYIARLIKFVGTSFLTEMKRNIAKLRARHGTQGFSKEGDMNRDLASERKTLEGEG